MGRKKGQRKKSVLPSPPLPPEDKALLDSLLAEYKNNSPELLVPQIPNSRLARVLVERLPTDDKATIPLLEALYKAYNQKDIRKAIRRAAFRLRQHGFEAPFLTGESHPEPSFLRKANHKEEAEAFLGVIDGFGSRGVYVALPRTPSGYDIGIGQVNDEKGIIEFHSAHCSKKRMKELKTAVQGEMEINIQVSVSHAATVLEYAYGKSLQGALDVPREYAEFRSLLLSQGSTLDRPPVYDFFPEWPDAGDAPTRSQMEKLFSHPSIGTWTIPLEKMEPLLLQLEDSEEGPLLLSEVQQEERVRSIKEKWAEEYFHPEMVNILKYRLEEMAYIFCKRDEKDYAGLALSAASRGLDRDVFHGMSPVLAFLLEKTIAHYEKLRDEMGANDEPSEDPSPRIILP